MFQKSLNDNSKNENVIQKRISNFPKSQKYCVVFYVLAVELYQQKVTKCNKTCTYFGTNFP